MNEHNERRISNIEECYNSSICFDIDWPIDLISIRYIIQLVIKSLFINIIIQRVRNFMMNNRGAISNTLNERIIIEFSKEFIGILMNTVT